MRARDQKLFSTLVVVCLAGFVLGQRRADAEGIIVGLSSGVALLSFQAPTPRTGPRALGQLELGTQLSPHTSAHVRIRAFRADGLNVVAALAGDWHLFRHLGVSLFTGLAAGQDFGAGHVTGAGAFTRIPLGAHVAARVAFDVAYTARNDFRGPSAAFVAGVETRWP